MNMLTRCDGLAGESDDLVIAAHRSALCDRFGRNFVARWHHAFDHDTIALQLRARDELHAGDDHIIVGVQANRELSGGEHVGG